MSSRTCSWYACAPLPWAPSPSSTGTPWAAMRFASEPPPVDFLAELEPERGRVLLRLREELPRSGCRLERRPRPVAGDADRRPSDDRFEPVECLLDGLHVRCARDANVEVASACAATTFSAVPPAILPTFTEMPRSWSVSACRRMIWCASSSTALAPSARFVPAWAGRPSTAMRKRPSPLRDVLRLPDALGGSTTNAAATPSTTSRNGSRAVRLPCSSSAVRKTRTGRRPGLPRRSRPASARGSPSCRRRPGRGQCRRQRRTAWSRACPRARPCRSGRRGRAVPDARQLGAEVAAFEQPRLGAPLSQLCPPSPRPPRRHQESRSATRSRRGAAGVRPLLRRPR